jgi:pimeloyl-ACP methyl ester carboxylesterase
MTGIDLERRAVTTADGRRLDVLVTGEPGAPAFVFHPGISNGVVALPGELDPAARGMRTVMYARPGYHGSTPRPGRAVADAAADTATVLDALGIDDFVTAGWSGGGPHALACAALLPDRCRATATIVSVAPGAGHGGLGGWHADTVENLRPLLRGDTEAFTAALERDAATRAGLRVTDLPELYVSAADKASLSGEFARWLAESLRTGYQAGVAGVREDWEACARDWGFDLTDARRVAVWHGDEDTSPVAHPAWLAEHIPGAELHLLPRQGHCSIIRRLPEIVDDLVRRSGVA